MIISFSGLDGSGKTTHADRVAAHMRARGLKCRKRHAIKGSLSYFLTHAVVGKVSSKAKESVESGLRGEKGLRTFSLSFIKKTLLLFDLIYFALRYGHYKGRKDRVLVSDRYFYDELVQLKYLGLAGGLYLGLYRSLIIRPDTAFYLAAEPAEAFKRKKEYDADYYIVKNGLYGEFGGGNGPIVEVPAGSIEYRQGFINSYADKWLEGKI